MPGLTTTFRHKLEVGSPENFVSFEIASSEAFPNLFAGIDIPSGKPTAQETYLCGDAETAQLHFMPEPPDKLDGSLTRQKTGVGWQSEEFPLIAGEKVTVTITGFNPEGGGMAPLHLKIWSDPDEPLLYDGPVTVTVSPAAGVAIIYFDVRPVNVLQGEKVTISSTSVGAGTLKLYAGDIEIPPVAHSGNGQTATVNRYTHTPQRATTYRLKAWQGRSSDDEAGDATRSQFAERDTSVVVEPRNAWYSHDLLINSLGGSQAGQRFYPTLLLAAKDLSGKTEGDRLYGIFVNKKTKQAGLWSSSSGFDSWRWEADVPDGMGDSPGVIHKQTLWLIGGSSADPLGPVSNHVCWYYKDKDNRMVWKEWDAEGSERANPANAGKVPAARRCHTCAVFNDKVWVLGGLSEQNTPLDDVWVCSADPGSGDLTATWTQSGKLPSARCMSLSVATPTPTKIRGVARPRLWLFGGATHPYNLNETFNDLWWTEDGKNWQLLKLPGATKATPLAASLLYGSDEILHLAGVFRGTGGETQASEHGLLDAGLEPPSWRTGSLVGFGWDYSTDLFLIRSASFRERWIFWPVYQSWDEMEKFSPAVYNAP